MTFIPTNEKGTTRRGFVMELTGGAAGIALAGSLSAAFMPAKEAVATPNSPVSPISEGSGSRYRKCFLNELTPEEREIGFGAGNMFVTYVDNDRNAKRFFAQQPEVLALVQRNKTYQQSAEIVFHGCSYESELAEPDNSFDLLLSLHAGFVSEACRRYLAVGGVLAVNNSHADASLASIDPGYEFIGVVQGRGERLRVVQDGLDAYFRPKQDVEITEQLLRKLGRGIGYTKTAPAYVFRRTSAQ